MQPGVFGFVGWPIVVAPIGGKFNSIDEFYIGAFIDFGRVASGKIWNEKPERPAGLFGKRLAVEFVNDHRPIAWHQTG